MSNVCPKISVNKLGEYMGATAGRRRTIISDQKNPSVFKAAYYSDAREVLSEYLAGGLTEDELAHRLDHLIADNRGSDFQQSQRNSSARVIGLFRDNFDGLEFSDEVNCVDRFSRNEIHVRGVNISVRPDLILRNRNTNEVIGAVKFHFSKSAPLHDMGCEYVATILRMYLEQEYSTSEIDIHKCIVIDVHEGVLKSAPKAYVKRRKDIEAACEEIGDRWDSV
jgi:hypothetical protein